MPTTPPHRSYRATAPASVLALAAVLAASAGPPAVGGSGLAHAAESCEETTITARADADAWVDQNSPFSNKGSDAVMTVRSAVPAKNARILVRFPLPASPPPGCVVEAAKLRLFSGSGDESRTLEAVRAGFGWSESLVTWGDQPATVGAPASTWAGEGYIQWNVAAQVEEMIAGANHGFLIRDRVEDDEAGGDQSFYSREKGESNPELVVRFAAPKGDEPPGPPAPPAPAAVSCGQELMKSTLVTNDLSECPGDGLVIGRERIIVDLGGHTIDGKGLGSGVRNDGYDVVTIRNGTIRDFDFGVQLHPETNLNLVERLSLNLNQLGGIELADAGALGAGNEIRGNVIEQNGDGIALVKGTIGTTVTGNTMTLNSGPGLRISQSDGNWLEGNRINGSGDLGVGFEHATGNTLLRSTISSNSDGGIELLAGSHGNRIEDNVVTSSGDHGILVGESDRTELIDNVAQHMSDSGITLNTGNDGVVRGNDVRFNSDGIQMDGSSRNIVESNNASETRGHGIEMGGGSLENHVVANQASLNGAQGLYLADEALDGLGNLVERNVANGNLSDGIATGKGGHVLAGNVVNENGSLGISAALGTIDGGRNAANGNRKPEQCIGVVCRPEWNPPETTITAKPADATTGSSATFSFTGSDDRSAATGLRFECRLDNASFAACQSPRSYSGLSQGSHRFEVRAIDAVGNVDESPAMHTWSVDTTPPDTSIESGPPALASSGNASFAFAANEPGSRFECRLDGGPFAACESPRAYSGLSEGAHAFEVRAIDRAGNVDQSPARHSWSVDTTPPDTSIGSGPAAVTSSTEASFAFAASEAGTRFECRLDGGAFAACQSPRAYSGLGEGTHSFEVRAIDAAGNVDPSPAAYSWTVDTTPPETSIGSGPAAVTSSTEARFVFSASEAGSSFECRLDGGAFADCESPRSYSDLSEGAHSFEVRATDPAGNVDPSPASHSWTVDRTPPETSLGERPPGTTNSATARFSFDGGDDRTAGTDLRFECRLDGGAFAACASPKVYEALAEGSHSFDVRAIDAAGNVDPSPASHSWTVDTTPPETSIDSAPPAMSPSTDARFTFAGQDDRSAATALRFECRLDGSTAGFGSCSSPKLYEGLSDGSHTFEVRAIDLAGNADPTPASYSWTVDTTPPESSLGERPPELSNSAGARFTFAAGEPGSRFECRLDGGVFAACASPKTFEILADGSHTFEVRAIDAAGNVDPSPASYTWRIDTTPPETSIESGPAAITSSTDARFVFSASEADSRLECRLDDETFTACESPRSYSGLADGSHTFEVRAVDAAGNVDPSPASYSWTVDTTPPETAITERPPGTSNSGAARFSFAGEDDRSAAPALRFECRLDDETFTACESPRSYSGLADGSHTFEVRATDAAGNVDPSPASYTWNVDTTPPDTSIDSGPPAVTSNTQASFAFTASEPGSRFECRLDDETFTACESPRSYSGLADGSHSFEARAIDAAGNVDPSPASYTWRIDTTPPETSIDSGPPAVTSSTQASFGFGASEPGSRFECRLDGAAEFSSCSSPKLYGGLSEGSHTFEVRAVDGAGNVDPSPASYSWTVDTTAPQTSIDSGPPATTSSSEARFEFSAGESGSTFQCRLDGGSFAPCTSPLVYTGLADGAHSFEVRAIDRAGNIDASPAAHAWRVETATPEPPPDTQPPQTTIGERPANPSTSRSATFTFSGSDDRTAAGELGFECRLDNAAAGFTSCQSPRLYEGLTDGTHTFEVRAADAAGNVDPTPAAHTWTVDATPPDTSIGSGPPTSTSSTDASFAFSSNEAGTTFECRLDSESFAGCKSPMDYTGLSQGSHTFAVRAIDAAGNLDSTPAMRAWTITPPAGCGTTTIRTAAATADSWVLQSSPTSRYGSDSVLKVDSKTGARARAFVQFALPAIADGCRVVDAKLRLYASSYKTGRTLQALRLAAPWTESALTWNNQPVTTGSAATAASGEGYRQWIVTSQAQNMYSDGNNGFVIRDAAEDGAGIEQGFHSREKGTDNPPQLVLTFG